MSTPQVIDNVKYTHNLANASAGWKAFKSATGALAGASLQSDLLSVLVSALGSQHTQAAEDLVWSNVVVQIDNEPPFKLHNKFDEHFNKHRAHLVKVLVEGVKVQFGPFFNASELGNLMEGF